MTLAKRLSKAAVNTPQSRRSAQHGIVRQARSVWTARGFSAALWVSVLFGAWNLVLGASLEINITPKFSGEPIQPDSLRYQTSAAENFSITRISYLVSGFALQHTDGSWLELTNEVAWFDMERGRSSHRISSLVYSVYSVCLVYQAIPVARILTTKQTDRPPH